MLKTLKGGNKVHDDLCEKNTANASRQSVMIRETTPQEFYLSKLGVPHRETESIRVLFQHFLTVIIINAHFTISFAQQQN